MPSPNCATASDASGRAVYTTCHHASTGANVITIDYSDWATKCPEYKVTAVEVRRTNYYSEWQERNREEDISLTLVCIARGDSATVFA